MSGDANGRASDDAAAARPMGDASVVFESIADLMTFYEVRDLDSLAHGGLPWLLKLHGDLERPESLVFTSDDYRTEAYRALHGVVQSLLLTSHVLFVGFSMTDTNFLHMAEPAHRVRAEASDSGGADALAGTALALAPEFVPQTGLDIVALSTGADHDKSGGRVLEIFLDRVAWRTVVAGPEAAAFLLDPRFHQGLSGEDSAAKSVLNDLQAFVATAPESTATRLMREFLESLGHD